jgi:predicted protein tyrosine phosphatase
MSGPFPDSYWLIEGRLLAGEYPGHWQEDKAREKLQRLLDSGIRSFVDLTETSDPLLPYEPLLREIASELTLDVHYQRLSIPDMGIPTTERMTEILDRVRSELAEGRPVYFHCWGGIGRTGTVACCWLVEEGHDCNAAFERLNVLRGRTPDGYKDSPQTDEQCDFVRAWRKP